MVVKDYQAAGEAAWLRRHHGARACNIRGCPNEGVKSIPDGRGESWAYCTFHFALVLANLRRLVGLAAGCFNCDDGCPPARWCEGCGRVVCQRCWDEHNEDGPCHA